MSNKLPKGWILSPLGSLFDFVGGGTPDKKNPDYWGGEIPWATIKDIKGKYLVDTIDHITQEGLENSTANLTSTGDLILATRISPGLSVISRGEIAINQDLKAVKHYAGMSSEFSFFLFKNIEKQIREFSSGTTVLGVRLNILREIKVGVPPLNEQHRIVAKIEQLFSALDKGVAELKAAKKKLELYRQSLLKAAFEGRLTEKWRREHAGELETAEELLARIKAEREKRYQQQLEEWQQAVKKWEAQGKPGKKPRKPRKPKELPPLTEEELAQLPKLPEGWGWVTFEQAGFWQGGGTPSKRVPEFWADGELPWITPKDMKERYLYESQDKISRAAVVKSSVKLIKAPSVLFVVRSGILRRVLPVAVAQINTVVNQDIKAIEPYIHLPELIYWYALGHERYIREGCAKAGTTVESIEFSKLLRYPLPLLSFHEQQIIVKILEDSFKILDHLTRTIDHALAQADLLRQAILKKAFFGQLVPQDPNDEPASELLKRIKAEREAAKAGLSGQRGRCGRRGPGRRKAQG